MSWGTSTTRPRTGSARAARITIAAAIALAVVTACTPPTGTSPPPTTVNYGGTNFEYREGVRYANTGYEETRYDLWLPLTGSAPLVVFVHGGFWSTQGSQTRKSLPPQVKDLLLSGYAVASIDYRGVTQTCTGPCSQAQILGDVKAAISDIVFLTANGRVTDEVHLVGFSAGGHLSLMAGMTYNDPNYPSSNGFEVRPTTVTSIAGPTDLEALWAFSDGNLLARGAMQNYAGGFAPNNAVHSPISQTADNGGQDDPPLYLIYSSSDELVPYAQATAMVNAATAAGIDVTLSPRTGIAHDPMRLQVNTAQLAAWLAAH